MNKSKITGVKSYGDGVKVIEYDDGRIKVKLPTKVFNHLKSLVADGPDSIYQFLGQQGMVVKWKGPNKQEGIIKPKSYIEQHTGHICYAGPTEIPEDLLEAPEDISVPKKPKAKAKKKAAK